MADPFAGNWYDVRVTIDRGEGAKPRVMASLKSNHSPLRFNDAQKLAADEGLKPYITAVEIVERTSYAEA